MSRDDIKADEAYVRKHKLETNGPMQDAQRQVAEFGSGLLSAGLAAMSQAAQQVVEQVIKEVAEDAKFLIEVQKFAPWFDLSETSRTRLSAKLCRMYPATPIDSFKDFTREQLIGVVRDACESDRSDDSVTTTRKASASVQPEVVSSTRPKKQGIDWARVKGDAMTFFTDKTAECVNWSDSEWARQLGVKRQTLFNSEAKKPLEVVSLIRAFGIAQAKP